MKQQIVIKVHVDCSKCRSKALQLVASANGVDSVAIQGEYKDQVVVVGDGVDSISLTQRLRKKVGYADIISVGDVKKDGEKAKKNQDSKG